MTQDNRLNAPACDLTCPSVARPWRQDLRKVFNTEEAGRTSRARSRMQIALRAKRLDPYSVASTSSPASFVLKIFLT